jgi:hypothetical protein
MNTQEIITRLIERGSFDLNSDAEFNALPRKDKDHVRMIVRFNLLQES